MKLKADDHSSYELAKLIATNIIYLRTNKNLSQEKLAEISNVNVKIINKIENVDIYANIDTIADIAHALGVKTYILFKDNGYKIIEK